VSPDDSFPTSAVTPHTYINPCVYGPSPATVFGISFPCFVTLPKSKTLLLSNLDRLSIPGFSARRGAFNQDVWRLEIRGFRRYPV